MKSSPLLVLCAFSCLTIFAKLPSQEEFPSSLAPSLFSGDENSLLEESFSLLDEEWEDLEEGLNTFDTPVGNPAGTSEMVSFETMQSDAKSPTIDIAQPLAIDDPISLQILEEKIPGEIPYLSPVEPSSTTSPMVAKNPSIDLSKDTPSLSLEEGDASDAFSIESSSSEIKPNLDVQLDLKRAFAGSPLIYTLLFGMSVFSVCIWLYSLLSLKKIASIPQPLLKTLHGNLNGNHFDEALSLCRSQDALLCKMLASGIQSRKYGLSVMVESMKAEGKRSSMSFWQKIGLLNDIAILAPMLGLLGTVLGMFYAFYDVNRSIESITSLFDGLGISVGTTVAGLIVAILALILHSTAKYRLIKVLSQVEAEAHSATSLIDNHTSLYESK